MRSTLRDRRLVRRLVDWLTGGLAARLEFVERDLCQLEARAQRLAQSAEPAQRPSHNGSALRSIGTCRLCGSPLSAPRTGIDREGACPNRCSQHPPG